MKPTQTMHYPFNNINYCKSALYDFKKFLKNNYQKYKLILFNFLFGFVKQKIYIYIIIEMLPNN